MHRIARSEGKDSADALTVLLALAQDARLRTYRALLDAGADGMAAGELSDRTGVPPTSLSGHLGILTRVGILSRERRGRSIVYRASTDRVRKDCSLLTGSDAGPDRPD